MLFISQIFVYLFYQNYNDIKEIMDYLYSGVVEHLHYVINYSYFSFFLGTIILILLDDAHMIIRTLFLMNKQIIAIYNIQFWYRESKNCKEHFN